MRIELTRLPETARSEITSTRYRVGHGQKRPIGAGATDDDPTPPPAASTFVFRKPRKIGEAEACELVHIALRALRISLGDDARAGSDGCRRHRPPSGRAKDGPGGFNRFRQKASSAILKLQHEHICAGNSLECKMFPLFPGHLAARPETY